MIKTQKAQNIIWEHCKIVKNTYFEKHLRTAASDSSYILLKKLNEIVQEPDCLSVSFWNIKLLYFTYSHSYSIVLSIAVIRCHSMSFFVTRSHSLSIVVPLVVNRFTTRCHSLSFVVTRCHLLYHSLSLVVTCCTTRLSFYKRSFSSIDLLDAKDVKFQKKFDRW